MYHGHGAVLERISYSPELRSGVSYVTSILNEQEELEFEASYDDFEVSLTPHTLNHGSLLPFVPIILGWSQGNLQFEENKIVHEILPTIKCRCSELPSTSSRLLFNMEPMCFVTQFQ